MVITKRNQIQKGFTYYQTIFDLDKDGALRCTVFSVINVIDVVNQDEELLFTCKETILAGWRWLNTPFPVTRYWFSENKDSTFDRTFTNREEAQAWIKHITTEPLTEEENEIYNKLIWIYNLHLELNTDDEHEWDM